MHSAVYPTSKAFACNRLAASKQLAGPSCSLLIHSIRRLPTPVQSARLRNSPSSSLDEANVGPSLDRASATETHDVLRVAEHDLSDYCTNLYEDDETERCWLAYQYFEEKKAGAERGCDIEIKDGIVHGVDCQRLDQFEGFVRQMVKEGRVRNMAKTLASLAGAERRKNAREIDSEPSTLGELVAVVDGEVPGNSTPAKDALKAVLAEVFNQHDFNKDGRMDVQEFRTAMRSMGDELSAHTVETIFQSMDAHGWLTFDEFVAIVEAEEVRAHSRFAKGLRTLARGSSKWWTHNDIVDHID